MNWIDNDQIPEHWKNKAKIFIQAGYEVENVTPLEIQLKPIVLSEVSNETTMETSNDQLE